MTFDHNDYYKKRVKILFWLGGISIIILLILLSLNIYGKAAVTKEVTFFFLFIPTCYSIKNALVRWKNQKDRNRGEIFVYIVWSYSLVVYLIACLTGNLDFIPDQLALTWGGVTAIFLGTGSVKIIRDLFF